MTSSSKLICLSHTQLAVSWFNGHTWRLAPGLAARVGWTITVAKLSSLRTTTAYFCYQKTLGAVQKTRGRPQALQSPKTLVDQHGFKLSYNPAALVENIAVVQAKGI